MRVRATTEKPADSRCDTVALTVFDGDKVASPALQALLERGEARTAAGSLALAHEGSQRWLLVGLGRREEFDAEAARVAGARVAAKAAELGAASLCFRVPDGFDEATIAAAVVEGVILASYRFDRYRTATDPPAQPRTLDELVLATTTPVDAALARAQAGAQGANRARILQDTPSNHMTPTVLGERARQLAEEFVSIDATVEGREAIVARGMGAFAAVAQGTYEEPALITLRYEGPAARGPLLGFIGKGVTFDSGGISLKPGERMHEMKFDMSGAAAVIEAIGAIASLELPVRVIGVVGATENMPSGRSMKPGDIVTTLAGLTVEINNTDAEGRLVLADCMAYAIAEGAERLLDLATLTGACLVALGHTHAGLLGNDDAWCAEVLGAATRSGELAWRLPLHREYAKLIEGTYADINNAPAGRLAGTIAAGEFLRRFAGETPWAHLDIAGTAWDLGRTYAEKGGSGFGVRMMVELAASAAQAQAPA
jgi:leucyl aminopeptidase